MINELLNYATDTIVNAILKDNPSDLFHEIADSNVDIYYYDIYKSAGEVSDYVEQARDEGLIGEGTTLDKQIQIGQYYKYLQELQTQWEDFIIEVDTLLNGINLDELSEPVQLAVITQALKGVA